MKCAPPAAYAQVQAGKLTLINIRRPDEWRQTGVAKGALRINMVHPRGQRGSCSRCCARRATRIYNIKEGMVGSAAGPGWIARGLPLEACNRC